MKHKWHEFIYNLLFIVVGGFIADMEAGYWAMTKYEKWVTGKGKYERKRC